MNPESIPLRDIHLPTEVSWWPLATIWWVILALIILLPIAIHYLLKWRRERFITRANKQLQIIVDDYQNHQDSQLYCKNLSIFLRQCAMTIKNRQQTAALTGKKWLGFLDGLGNTQEFSDGVGQILLTAPYQQQPVAEVEQLEKLIKKWVKVAYQKRNNIGSLNHV